MPPGCRRDPGGPFDERKDGLAVRKKKRNLNRDGTMDVDVWRDRQIYGEGLVEGYGNGYFGTDDNITREQMATLIFNYANYLGLDTSARASLDKFPDGIDTQPWAKAGMQWAVAVGLYVGDDTGTLRPGDDMIRAEAAELMMRVIKLIVK